jgi:hypothetical protein
MQYPAVSCYPRILLTISTTIGLWLITISIANAALSSWSNEPTGSTAISDWSFNALTGSGWNINNGNGNATIQNDSSAPFSPSNVGQWRYPNGFTGGKSPAVMYYSLPSSFKEGYVGLWWKPSNPWQSHSSNVNKIYFLFGNVGHIIPVMYGSQGGPYQLRIAPEWSSWTWLTPNINNVPVTLGVWHKIELYFKSSTSGGANGIIRWWMDGTLIGDYANVWFPSDIEFEEFQIAPTWGGIGGVKTETDYFWFDHIHISKPTGVPQPDSVPPAPPRNLTVMQ